MLQFRLVSDSQWSFCAAAHPALQALFVFFFNSPPHSFNHCKNADYPPFQRWANGGFELVSHLTKDIHLKGQPLPLCLTSCSLMNKQQKHLPVFWNILGGSSVLGLLAKIKSSSAIKSTCSCRGPRLCPQHPRGDSQLFTAPVPGDQHLLLTSMGMWNTCDAQTYVWPEPHTHKIR